jgi:CRP/FNR family transcriptional regulator
MKIMDREVIRERESKGTIDSFLKVTEPFRRLPEDELDRTISLVQETFHARDEHIYSEGEEAGHVWVLKSGRIEIIKYTSEGKPRAIETVLPGQLYGSIYDKLDEGRTYPNNAVAYVNSVSLRIPMATFLYLMHRSLPFVTGLCMLYSRRISDMQSLNSISQEPVAKRVARTLVDLSERIGKTLSITKREIAELAGTSVETSIRTLGAFEKKHWISSSRGEIRLMDMTKMKSFCG